MKPLSVTLVLFGVLALVQPARQLDLPGALLGIVVLLCAAANEPKYRRYLDRDTRVGLPCSWQVGALAS